MGRPRSHPDELANCSRTIRLTRRDMDRLHELARLTGKTGAHVIRQLIRSTRGSGEDPGDKDAHHV